MDHTERATEAAPAPEKTWDQDHGTDSRTRLDVDAGQPTWDLLAVKLEALIKAWDESQHPPVLSTFVPPGSPALRKLVLTELIKVDLDYRWQRRLPKLIEDYAAEFPDLMGPQGVSADLIFEEFQVRKRAGEAVSAADYHARFPGQAKQLGRLLGVDLPTRVTLAQHAAPAKAINAGDQIDDFDLLALIGEGAFAKVFLARQKSMQRLVALKISADQGAEPQTLAQLDHPHIVRVHDQRVLEDRGLRLLYMPYVPGGTLHDVLKRVSATPVHQRSGKLLLESVDENLHRRGELAPLDSNIRNRIGGMSWAETVCWLGARIAEALQYAHDRGVLHRDVKPANVLLGADAAPRLADFNVGWSSKLDGVSPAAFFGGSIGYMSPEQLEAFNPSHPRKPDSLDARSDVYSLGITLWELLTGRRPFSDEQLEHEWSATIGTLTERRRAGISDTARASLPGNLPPGMAEVLLKCLDADESKRYHSAGDVARQLDICLKPRTRELLYPSPGWRTWARRNPLIALFAVGLTPNILAAFFSIEYNQTEIVNNVPQAQAMFERLMLIVNSTFFPVGILMFYLVARPVAVGLRALDQGHPSIEQLTRWRRHSTRLGLGAMAVCLSAWVISAVVFPVSLHLTVHAMPFAFHAHFLASQTLCGLIAVTYPLFGGDLIVVRSLYPAFIPQGMLQADDIRQLQSFEKRIGWQLLIAASMPLLALGLLALSRTQNHLALGVLAAAGFAGVTAAYFLSRGIRIDLAALQELAETK